MKINLRSWLSLFLLVYFAYENSLMKAIQVLVVAPQEREEDPSKLYCYNIHHRSTKAEAWKLANTIADNYIPGPGNDCDVVINDELGRFKRITVAKMRDDRYYDFTYRISTFTADYKTVVARSLAEAERLIKSYAEGAYSLIERPARYL